MTNSEVNSKRQVTITSDKSLKLALRDLAEDSQVNPNPETRRFLTQDYREHFESELDTSFFVPENLSRYARMFGRNVFCTRVPHFQENASPETPP